MEEEAKPKWEGKASVELDRTTPDQAWRFLGDFCNLHQLIPKYIDTCYRVDGVPGQPGLTRYCSKTTSSDSSDGAEATTPTVKWANERLLTIDRSDRVLSYEVLDNNIGFKSYVATLKVSPTNTGGCSIEWSFVCDPIEGWGLEYLKSYIDHCLQAMGKKIEEAIHNE